MVNEVVDGFEVNSKLMKGKILIVEDELIFAADLKITLERIGYKVCGIAKSVDQALNLLQNQKPEIVLLDIFLKGDLTGIDLAHILREKHIPFVFLSANSNQEVLVAAKETQPYGFLVKPIREKDLLVTLDIAHYKHQFSVESKLQKEYALIKDLQNINLENNSWTNLLADLTKALQPFISFDYLATELKTESEVDFGGLGFLRIGFDEYQIMGSKELATISRTSEREILSLILKSRKDHVPVIYTTGMLEEACRYPNIKRFLVNTFKIKSHMAVPVQLPDGEVFYFNFYSKLENSYTQEHLNLCYRLQSTLSQILDKIVKQTPSAQSKPSKGAENVFERIVGRSPQLLQVLDLVSQVAETEISVLILGESGTGKEGVADSIHRLSPRSKKPFVRVNCASLPSSLIESELFGHEKGAFTGAYEKHIGKFEQAQGGTIFLDEIGEMPLEMQSKLLRVLQEKEIERVGGKGSVKIDVRIIAATNRNLEKEVAEGRFRMDLYYRLNIFPVMIPALRDRIEDIEDLVTYFVDKFSAKLKKDVRSVSLQAMSVLSAYSWPGNIRELENLIERNVLLCKGSVIDKILFLPSSHVSTTASNLTREHIKTIDEIEKEHILHVLKISNGRIYGAGGAAELLNLPPTTLASKIKRHNIMRSENPVDNHDI